MNHHDRVRRGILPRCYLPLALIALLPAVVMGQSKNPFFADEARAIQRVSLAESPEGIPLGIDHALPKTTDVVSDTSQQLRVSIQYLLVDDATRRKIYAQLPLDAIRHTRFVPQTSAPTELESNTGARGYTKQIHTHGHSATCVIDTPLAKQLVELAVQSTTSRVSLAPSVILQQNRTAEINDRVQRPFVVDFQADRGQPAPVVHTVNEGTRVRLFARQIRQTDGDDSIQLTTEFLANRILAVDSTEVLGMDQTPTTLQNPILEATTVIVTEKLGAEQWLWIDPHVKKQTTVDVATKSMLSSLPIVGRAFAGTEPQSVENHMIVLIKPSVHAEAF